MDRLMAFINDENDYCKLRNKFELNQTLLLAIISVIDSLERINSIIQDLVKFMIYDYEAVASTSADEFEKFKRIVMDIKTHNFSSVNNFVTELKEIFKKEDYQKIYERIEYIQFLHSIFDRINFDKINKSDLKAYDQFMNSVSGESITKNFQKELKLIENIIMRDDRIRIVTEELHQERNKRIEVENARIQAENRANQIEFQMQKLDEEIKIKKSKFRKAKEENKNQSILLIQKDEEIKKEKEKQILIQEQNQFLKDQIEFLKSLLNK